MNNFMNLKIIGIDNLLLCIKLLLDLYYRIIMIIIHLILNHLKMQ